MDTNTYDRMRKQLLDEAEKIQTSKRPGYTQGNPDVLRNFKSVGERVRTAKGEAAGPGVAWGVYFLKHVDAIMAILTQPNLPVSETPVGRFADAINYLQLGYALYVEQQGYAIEASDVTLREGILQELGQLQAKQAAENRGLVVPTPIPPSVAPARRHFTDFRDW